MIKYIIEKRGERMRYYVVADPHGFYDELISALTEKGFFSDTGPRKLIICGDLFDRGEKAMELQELIISLMERDEVILIRGNHEDLFVEMIENLEVYLNYIKYTHHYQNGTYGTALALSGMSEEDVERYTERFKNTIYRTPYYSKIIPSMVNYFETEHYIFVHGWIPCRIVRVGLDERKRFFAMSNWRNATPKEWRDARWYNGMDAWKSGALENGKTIVCGHFHTSWGHSTIDGNCSEWGEDADFSPFIHDGIIALDACTARTGKINVLVIDD